jgi:hypothetical protein
LREKIEVLVFDLEGFEWVHASFLSSNSIKYHQILSIFMLLRPFLIKFSLVQPYSLRLMAYFFSIINQGFYRVGLLPGEDLEVKLLHLINAAYPISQMSILEQEVTIKRSI